MNQCVFRKIQELGLVALYNSDEDFKVAIRRFNALPLLPIELVEEAFDQLERSLIESYDRPECHQFIAYYRSTWIDRNALFGKEIWNQCEETRRTNNDVEGFHNLIGSLIGAHPNIFSAIETLKDIQKMKEKEIENFERTGVWDSHQKEKYKRVNRRILDLTQKLLDDEDEEMDVLRFLTTAQHLLAAL